MRIRNHRLDGQFFGKSLDVGPALGNPHFIVMHYTAGGAGADSRDYMMLSPGEKARRSGVPGNIHASAHVVVDRDGSLWQIVPFNLMANHAGRSQWRGLTSLNRYSIGIEIANYGWLDRQGDGSYRRPGTPRFMPEQVTIGRMPNGIEIKGWENYPAEQLAAVERVTRSLLAHYPTIREIVGHEEIAPGRKFDPGPAFPLQRFKNLVDDRGTGTPGGRPAGRREAVARYVTTTRLNIRGGPGLDFEKLAESPLPTGTVLVEQDARPPWLAVRLADSPGVLGWVHGDYVTLLAEETA